MLARLIAFILGRREVDVYAEAFGDAVRVPRR